MDARTRYFNLLETVIYDGKYLYLLFLRHHRRRQRVEAALAVLSGGALAAWLLYNELAIWYAAVIVLTQIINSILPAFEIAKHEEALKQAVAEFQPVKRMAEMGWRRIDRERLSDKAIEEMFDALQLEEANVFDKMLLLGIPFDKELGIEAAKQTDQYIETNFQASS